MCSRGYSSPGYYSDSSEGSFCGEERHIGMQGPCIDGKWVLTQDPLGHGEGRTLTIRGATITWEGQPPAPMRFDYGVWMINCGTPYEGQCISVSDNELRWNFMESATAIVIWERVADAQTLNSDIQRVQEAYSAGGDGGGGGSLSNMLGELGMSQYEDAFINDLGVTEVEDLKYVTAEDLAEIDIRGPKARRILQSYSSM